MRFRLFRHVLHGWSLVFPLCPVSGGGFTLSNSNSATTVAVRFAVWMSRRASSLESDHWPGDLILEPCYQRCFSGDLWLRLSFYFVRFPFAHCAITDQWVYFRFWVALAWRWVWDGLLAFVILFVVSGGGFKLSNSNSASTLGGRISPWSITRTDLPVQSLIWFKILIPETR